MDTKNEKTMGEVDKNRQKMKQSFVENGRILTNTAKVAAVLIALAFNVVYLILNRQIASVEEQKSVLLLCAFIIAPFTPIDISIILKNMFGGR